MRRKIGAHLPWNWPTYEGDVVHGVSCDGDLEVDATTGWWSIVSGVLWRWKTVAILKASSEEEIYTGFVAHDGTTRLCTVPVPVETVYGMFIGREPVTFFAVIRAEGQWKPVELELVARVRRNDPEYRRFPLY